MITTGLRHRWSAEPKKNHPKEQKPIYNPGALVSTHNMASRELTINCINSILTKFQMRLLNFGHIFRGLGRSPAESKLNPCNPKNAIKSIYEEFPHRKWSSMHLCIQPNSPFSHFPKQKRETHRTPKCQNRGIYPG